MPGAASASTTAPNTSLYVRNIPSKIKKRELRRQLYSLFIAYGKVIDVVATRHDGMREQAFVVFQDLASSTAALRALDGFSFYGRALSIDYAKTKSKATVVAEQGPEALFSPSLGFSIDGTASKKAKLTYSSAGAELKGRERKRAREEAGQRSSDEDDDGEEEEEDDDDDKEDVAGDKMNGKRTDGPPEEKRLRPDTNGEEGQGGAEEVQIAQLDDEDEEDEDTAAALGAPIPAAGDIANNLLFVDSVPDEVTEETLSIVFENHSGFSAVQVVPAKVDRTPPTACAFVEFKSTKHASAALERLRGYKFPSGVALQIAFALRAAR